MLGFSLSESRLSCPPDPPSGMQLYLAEDALTLALQSAEKLVMSAAMGNLRSTSSMASKDEASNLLADVVRAVLVIGEFHSISLEKCVQQRLRELLLEYPPPIGGERQQQVVGNDEEPLGLAIGCVGEEMEASHQRKVVLERQTVSSATKGENSLDEENSMEKPPLVKLFPGPPSPHHAAGLCLKGFRAMSSHSGSSQNNNAAVTEYIDSILFPSAPSNESSGQSIDADLPLDLHSGKRCVVNNNNSIAGAGASQLVVVSPITPAADLMRTSFSDGLPGAAYSLTSLKRSYRDHPQVSGERYLPPSPTMFHPPGLILVPPSAGASEAIRPRSPSAGGGIVLSSRRGRSAPMSEREYLLEPRDAFGDVSAPLSAGSAAAGNALRNALPVNETAEHTASTSVSVCSHTNRPPPIIAIVAAPQLSEKVRSPVAVRPCPPGLSPERDARRDVAPQGNGAAPQPSVGRQLKIFFGIELLKQVKNEKYK